jgi:hypothetical protein
MKWICPNNANSSKRLALRKSLLASSGLTLVELLVASSLLPIIIILASQIFVSQVRGERTLLGVQSSENLRSRLSFLLESDIADGEAALNPANTLCPQITGKLFSIRSPYLNSGGAINYACISYVQSGNFLIRSGPPILANGSLDYQSAPISQQVAKDVQISGIEISTSATKIDLTLTIPGFLGMPAKSYTVAYGTKNLRVGT